MLRTDSRFAVAAVLATTLGAIGYVGCSSAAEEPSATPVPVADASADVTVGEVDSGTPAAVLKAPGEACEKNKECESKKCTSKVCTTPTCTDGKLNQDETGVDCGGSCGKCTDETCGAHAECASKFCNVVCAPRPEKYCGVGLPTLCADADICELDADCTADYCNDDTVCAAPTSAAFSDGRRNAGETDVDCGGPSGKGCAGGKVCKVSDDCLSTCDASVCATPSDTDGKKNNGETDVDCGGPNAKKCVVGKVCLAAADCGLAYCNAGACAVPSASDNVKNGTETDKDCGGAELTFDGVTVPAGPGCDLKKTCAADSDCASTACAVNKICIEGKSCRQIHGGQTCGAGESLGVGQPGAQHESCCKSLKVPGVTVTVTENGAPVVKSVYLDKYEITAGRVREWVKAIKAQYGGVPNVYQWVVDRSAVDPLVAMMFSQVEAKTGVQAINYLPKQQIAQYETFIKDDGVTATDAQDMGLIAALGPESYYRGVQTGGTSGCYMGPTSYGHRTYWYTPEESAAYSEPVRSADKQSWLDEKSMNCMAPILFAAFCAWDGGYIQSQAAIAAAYGATTWPWGATPTPQDETEKITNWNNGTGGFNATKEPRYLWPLVNYATFASDLTPVIAAPGRFTRDATTNKDPNGESWMDLGGNMIEWSHKDGKYYGWTGASFEGHSYPRAWTGGIYMLDKYGKGGSRCIRLK